MRSVGPIEKDVPIKRDRQYLRRAAWRSINLPFDEMAVGDSFRVLPNAGQPLIVCQNAVSGKAHAYSVKTGYEQAFATRQIDGVEVRVWRTR